ncbi:glycosyl hydrolases family 2 [Paludibacter jiangxiensis]|uniref:Glycosyl hydrolases family 2 n=2 Tax=Paludibacter jiangxiensis TaxID=681398 RepID=A0A161LU01_9BACT|nr:glycosyl hydrolases family 2 [Paludibacter jiangxiensis]
MNKLNKLGSVAICLLAITLNMSAQTTSWPAVKAEAKPWARWWWLGSAVDKANLTYNMSEYAAKGMGGLEITPIYGVQGNDANNISYLSPKWMEMLTHTENEAARLGMKIDMNTGTGWPFGSPEVTIEDAACKVVFQDYILKAGETLKEPVTISDTKQQGVAKLSRLMAFSADGKKLDLTTRLDKTGRLQWKAPRGEWHLTAVFVGKTLQKVKRAAPGGEGWVMNHFSKQAVTNYLGRFDRAFAQNKTAYPHSFFNDSYEVFNADWTPDLFEQFQLRRGYKLEEYLPEFRGQGNADVVARVVSDYRETLSDLLQENFTKTWTDWAHSHGSTTRNQAHGSPGNLIDLYATVDIPECESFGISDFHIKGLRVDSIRKTNDSDISMLKYASSAAHISGKPLTSSETFTWLTDHFRTSLSQCKPDLDLFFISGVNHVYFHGTTYSPKEAAWPGWKFYATVDMSPTNTIWRDAAPLFSYIARCQSFLQEGKPDIDFLVYLPIYDMRKADLKKPYQAFTIHEMAEKAPKFIEAIHAIIKNGYDVDYISDQFVRSTTVNQGKLQTIGGADYKAILLPDVKTIPDDVMAHLLSLAKEGATVVFVGGYPQDVPGLGNLNQRKTLLDKLLLALPKITSETKTEVMPFGKGNIVIAPDYASALAACKVQKENMRTDLGLSCIRRSNETGHHYFISSLQDKGVDGWVPLAVNAQSAVLFDPMNGNSGKAKIRRNNGKTEVYLQLKSGGSVILKTFETTDVQAAAWHYTEPEKSSLAISKGWSMQFTESDPAISGTFAIDTLSSWTMLNEPNAKINKGTACYSVEFELPAAAAADWQLNLGDVRESARVRINGQDAGTLWAVPFVANVGKLVHPGKNRLEVEVTNLPANRIADYDRRGVNWRIFNEINMVNLFYKPGTYADWGTVPSGLLGPVTLTPLKDKKF